MKDKYRQILSLVYPPSHLRFYAMRQVRSPRLREQVSRLRSRFKPAASSDTRTLSPRAEAFRSGLIRDGFCKASDVVSAGQLSEITSYLFSRPCFDRENPSAGQFVISEVPSSCHFASYSSKDIVECPHLMDIVNNPDILASMASILGCKPTISNLSAWWSVAGKSPAQGPEKFHRDIDDWMFIKLFLYLTDVTEEAGPHVFVRGSHRIPKLLQVRRHEDDEVKREFGEENVLQFTGPAGTAFLENTFGFHKGTPPRAVNRLIFQAQYSLSPIGIYDYEPVTTTKIVGDEYTNRLYVARSK